MADTSVTRTTVDVDGQPASFLTAGEGPVVLLLHGTYWSRVWLRVLDPLAAAGLRPVAVDLPGLGRSGGELTSATATVPALTAWVARFCAALGVREPIGVAGHDIGGALAQRLLVTADGLEVRRLALINAVMYDSWPVPGVARYREPEVVASTSAADLVAARRESLTTALRRPVAPDEADEWLAPWNDERVARSWMALAGAADCRFTEELVGALRRSGTPKLLVWGDADTFQRVEHAERFADEMPATTLVRVPGGGHMPMEDDPGAVGGALVAFFAG